MRLSRDNMIEIYENYQKILSMDFDESNEFDENGNLLYPVQRFFNFLTDYLQNSKKPRIMSDDVFENIETEELYHGFKEYSHGANLIFDDKYHYGFGDFGQGTYLSTNFDDALFHTAGMWEDDKQNSNKVMKAKLISNKIISSSELSKLIRSDANFDAFDEEIKNNHKVIYAFFNEIKNADGTSSDFEHHIKYDMPAFASMLGFDCVINDNSIMMDKYKGKHLIITNRAAFAVPVSEAKKFLALAGDKYINIYQNFTEKV